MKDDLKNLFGADEECITISDLAKSQHYSLGYLLNAASSGRLKAFKIGDDWLTTSEWFSDYKSRIKDQISAEIAMQEEDNKWVEIFEHKKFRLAFVPQMVYLFVIFSFLSFSMSWLAFHPSGHQVALALEPITVQRHMLGNSTLSVTNDTYGFVFDAVSFLSSNSFNIIMTVYTSLEEVAVETAYLSSVVDAKLAKYQISDEVLTTKITSLISSAKKNYQQVAGASHIRQQIYFDEWQATVENRGDR